MQRKPLKRMGGAIATVIVALALIGCRGGAGQNGLNGTNGTDGTSPGIVIDAAVLTPEQWAALKPVGKITAVTMGAEPVVNFEIKDNGGNGIKNLGFTSRSSTAILSSYTVLAFSVAKLIPEDTTTRAPSKWVNYIVTTIPTITAPTVVPGRPTTDNTGTLVDNGNGTYKYTFYRDITRTKSLIDAASYSGNNIKEDLGDTTYQPSLPHRLTIQFAGNARGTGNNTPDGVTVATAVPMRNPINIIYDFIPALNREVVATDPAREVVAVNRCNECHGKLGSSFHGGARVETRYCIVCHTDQRKYGRPEATRTVTGYDPVPGTYKINGLAVGDFPALVHRIHQGEDLTKTGYNYANVRFNDIGYSMLNGGQRMCIKCHSSAAQADNWKDKPSRLACGACHDSIDWNTGANHPGGPQLNDQNCINCHNSAYIATKHQTQNLTPNNPTIAAGLKSFTYEINSATASPTNVVVKFRIKADGTPVTFVAPAPTVINPLAGFTGSPSFQLSWALTQDGVTTPVDYNNLGSGSSNFQPITVSIANLLSTTLAATMGSLAGPDSDGYYIATLVGTKIFPPGAMLRAVGLQGYFTQISPAAPRHAVSVVKAITGDAIRRKVVDSAKCANCHEWLEGHGGNRVYEVQVCVQCHVPGLTTSGRGISDTALETYRAAGRFTAKDIASLASWGIIIPNPVVIGSNFALNFPQTTNHFKNMIHGIHAGKTRTTPIRIVRDRTPAAINIINGARIGFPGILNNCQTCHTYNSYSGTPDSVFASRELADNGAVTTTAAARASLATVNATDKMITPFTASCVTCHDSTPAQAHMTMNGGQIEVNRNVVNLAGEACAVCHGAGSAYDPVKVHKK